MPASLQEVALYAFRGCSQLSDIYCYATNPPIATELSFEGVSKNCYIHVAVGSTRAYRLADGWSNFYHIFEVSELPAGEDEVKVTVTNNYATFSWPVNPTANSYTLEIKKNGELFCSLIFNAMGQLVGMNFAPERKLANEAATETAYGYSFVVNGLEEGTVYMYTFQALDIEGQILETKQGQFMPSSPTGITNPTIANQQVKVVEDGQLYIIINGVKYAVTGNAL